MRCHNVEFSLTSYMHAPCSRVGLTHQAHGIHDRARQKWSQWCNELTMRSRLRGEPVGDTLVPVLECTAEREPLPLLAAIPCRLADVSAACCCMQVESTGASSPPASRSIA
jgi:hypothetical protein